MGKGFGLGMLMGLAVGILFAPKSGAEIRKMLMRKKEEIGDRARHEAEMAASKVQSAAKSAFDSMK